jgi:hypothetical protein
MTQAFLSGRVRHRIYNARRGAAYDPKDSAMKSVDLVALCSEMQQAATKALNAYEREGEDMTWYERNFLRQTLLVSNEFLQSHFNLQTADLKRNDDVR